MKVTHSGPALFPPRDIWRVLLSYGDISDLLDEAVIAAGILLSFRWNTQNVLIACSWSLTLALKRIWEQEF